MEVSLTSFLDFVLKSGSPKMTCAQKINTQLVEPYDPAKDYYKRFRDAVQELHKTNLDKKSLSKLIGGLPTSKLNNYDNMVAGYKKFLGAKKVEWFDPPRKIWTHNRLEVPINPELGLIWDDQKYIIKLYLKSDQPSKDRFSSVLALMQTTLPTQNCKYMLLDVRNGKPYLFENTMLSLLPLIDGEAASLEFILESIK